MTDNQEQIQPETKENSSEVNLAKQRKMYERQLEQERQARAQAEERASAIERAARERESNSQVSDDDDNEPYIDKKRFKRGLNQFGEQIENKTKAQIEQAVQVALEEERKHNYLKENHDFNQIMTPELLQKFAEKHPGVANSILRMPDSFERQKLVYENIKALGLNKAPEKQQSIQDVVDANRKSPYYQPSGVGTAPYSNVGDFSKEGQKNAYTKMQELKNRLRI